MPVHSITRQTFQRQKHGGRVTAGPAQPRPGGDTLLKLHSDAATELPRLPPELAGSVHQITAPTREMGIVAFDTDSFPVSDEGYLQAVVQRHRLIDCADLMVPIGTLGENP